MQNGQVVHDIPPLPDAPMQSSASVDGGSAVEGGQQAYGQYMPDVPGARQYSPRPGDEKLFVRFYKRSVIDGEQTNAKGRPIYKDVDYVRIFVPGDKNTEIDTKVTDQHKGRFPRQWEQWQRTQTQATPEGTPLAEWPQITRSQAEELRFFGVLTVEQLAGLPDSMSGKGLMGFFDLRRKAQTFIGAQAENEKNAVAARENAELREMLAKQQAQIDALMKGKQNEPPSGGAGRSR